MEGVDVIACHTDANGIAAIYQQRIQHQLVGTVIAVSRSCRAVRHDLTVDQHGKGAMCRKRQNDVLSAIVDLGAKRNRAIDHALRSLLPYGASLDKGIFMKFHMRSPFNII